MNKASALSLVSNAILYWNTLKINNLVESLRQQGEAIDDETLSHISLLPYRHGCPMAPTSLMIFRVFYAESYGLKGKRRLITVTFCSTAPASPTEKALFITGVVLVAALVIEMGLFQQRWPQVLTALGLGWSGGRWA